MISTAFKFCFNFNLRRNNFEADYAYFSVDNHQAGVIYMTFNVNAALENILVLSSFELKTNSSTFSSASLNLNVILRMSTRLTLNRRT
jgi:hypothetical protein